MPIFIGCVMMQFTAAYFVTPSNRFKKRMMGWKNQLKGMGKIISNKNFLKFGGCYIFYCITTQAMQLNFEIYLKYVEKYL